MALWLLLSLRLLLVLVYTTMAHKSLLLLSLRLLLVLVLVYITLAPY